MWIYYIGSKYYVAAEYHNFFLYWKCFGLSWAGRGNVKLSAMIAHVMKNNQKWTANV